jgi:hypothetical protein
MRKDNQKFLLGAAIGVLAGIFVARKTLMDHGMPNAETWQRILDEEHDHIRAAVLMAHVQQRYRELIQQGITFESRALQMHLRENILPGLALYQTLLADGLDQEAALAQVDRLYATQYQTDGTNLQRLGLVNKYLPKRFDIFKWLVRNIMDRGFPSPGFELDYIPEEENRLGFDIHRCFYLDMFTYYGAPELTPAFCKIDDFTMSVLLPEIQWRRSGTLGTGATHCDFRWDYVPITDVD